ncbi:hypothetical protein FN846DRAFT_586606 [Sphaerosporella brunnea]|uniref:DUF726-domain-containing protein n=1 Tax=Sphaerosporella brunnea TaxID=1250544 RepID=A0A5J5F1H3_9PEZI|nr:hypothetical protein FN846DRAFT_586606 [Sphaerosporella brunnea]
MQWRASFLWHISFPANMPNNETDLVALLDRQQRKDLFRLIADITESMRSAIESYTNKPHHSKLTEPPIEASTVLQVPEKPDSLPSPQLTGLQQAALNSIDKWRASVLSRIAEALHAPPHHRSPPATNPPPALCTFGQKDLAWLQATYPPISTPLTQTLDPGHGELILQSLLLLLLSLESYDARSRVLLLRICSSLGIPLATLIQLENTTATSLLQAAEMMSASTETSSRAESSKNANWWKVSAASIAGAALIGVTGCLAAPMVAAGVGSVMGGLGLGATAAAGYLGALSSSGTLVGALFGAYGGRMSGRVMERYAKEVEDFSFLPLQAEGEGRLRVAIGITGWIAEHENEITAPWRVLGGGVETYALRWEVAALQDLGHALQTILTTYVMGKIKGQIIKRTLLATLYSALWPLGLMKAAKVVDNPFSIAKVRAEKAGLVLADAIIHRAQGERPVTLVGFSLGARVIYACLLSMAERGAFGLVENVVLFGAPVPASTDAWKSIRTVVAGRVINVFSSQDYILAFLYRTSSIQLGVAGLQNVEVDGVENVDVGDRVEGHLKYRFAVAGVLKELLRGDVEVREAEKMERELGELEKEEKLQMKAKGHADEDEVEEVVEKAGRELEDRRQAREREEGS